jgi:hypothetical protein
VAGLTSSDESSFPVACGPVLKYAGGQDAFVAKIAHVLLEGEGSLRPGTTLQWKLRATDDAGLRYQVGTSLHEGRIYIDKRKIMLMADPLLLLSVRGALPEVFVDYGGIVSASGRATASLRIPPEPALVGVKTYTVFVTLSPKAPSNIKSISDALSFMITKQ